MTRTERAVEIVIETERGTEEEIDEALRPLLFNVADKFTGRTEQLGSFSIVFSPIPRVPPTPAHRAPRIGSALRKAWDAAHISWCGLNCPNGPNCPNLDVDLRELEMIVIAIQLHERSTRGAITGSGGSQAHRLTNEAKGQ